MIAPRLKTDLIRYRKRGNQQQHRRSVNFGLLRDGIHPSAIRTKCWLKKAVVLYMSHLYIYIQSSKLCAMNGILMM